MPWDASALTLDSTPAQFSSWVWLCCIWGEGSAFTIHCRRGLCGHRPHNVELRPIWSRKRLFLTAKIPINEAFSILMFATQATDHNASNIPQQRVDIGFHYNLLYHLRKTGMF